MKQQVALLRGINVGAAGKWRKSVSMAALRELGKSLGWGHVQTCIQSGNVLFDASTSSTRAEERLTYAIAEHFGSSNLGGSCP